MRKTIHLVQINDIIGSNVILPLAIGILWQNAVSDPVVADKWKLDQVVYKPQDYKNIAEKLAQGDLVCFSNYIWNSHHHFAIAKQLKIINPNIFIVMGGPDISPSKKDFWKKYNKVVDLAIVGEGEQSIIDLLKIYPNMDVNQISGAWTKEIFTGEAKRIQELPYYTSPYLNGFYDDIVTQEITDGNLIQAVIQTNRGCPYRCTFCEEGRAYKNKMFFYDHNRVNEEIEWCAKNSVEYLSIADDNWGITERDIEYFRWIRDCKLKYGYPRIVDATFAKNAPERLLQLADIDAEHNTKLIRGFTIALQSLNSQTLKSIKRFNLVPDKQKTLIQGLAERNMSTYTEIIWPLPYENYKSLKAGLDKVIELGLDNWMGMYSLRLQEGTELYDDFANDYVFIDVKSSKQDDNGIISAQRSGAVSKSKWADTNEVVKGQVLYTWLAVLYFFGFARIVIDKLCKIRNVSVCTIIDEFLTFINSNKNLQLNEHNAKIQTWWSSWYEGVRVPDISVFSNVDTSYWSDYGHLASYLQINHQQFTKELKMFVDQQPVVIDDSVLTANSHSVVLYDNKYPYETSEHKVDVINEVPKFKSLYEFCRYFYWWKRKNGWHRTKIKHTL